MKKLGIVMGTAVLVLVIFFSLPKKGIESPHPAPANQAQKPAKQIPTPNPPTSATETPGRESMQRSPSDAYTPGEREVLEWVEGRVVDSGLEGIGQAKITILMLNPPSAARTYSEKEDFFADHDGFFRIPKLTTPPMTVFISAEGYISRLVTLPFFSDNSKNTIQLSPGGDFQIFVKDEDGDPIPNATIHYEVNREQHVDRDGFAQLHHLTNPAKLWVKAPGYNDAWQQSPLEEGFAVITLLHNGSFIGRVVDDEENTPVETFSFRFITGYFNSETLPVHDPDGRFEFHDLSRENHMIYIAAPGYLPQQVASEVILPKHLTKPVEIRLSKNGFFFEGRTLDQDGHPIPDASVTAFIGGPIETGIYASQEFPQRDEGEWNLLPFGWIGHLETTSNDIGQYKIGPLPEASILGLYAEAPQFAPTYNHQAETFTIPQRLRHDIYLNRYGTLQIQVGQETFPGTRKLWVYSREGMTFGFELEPGEKSIYLEEVRPGTVTARLSAFRNPRANQEDNFIPDDQTIEIIPGESHQLKIGVFDTFSLSGQVFIDRKPARDCRVIIGQQGGMGVHHFHRTDSNGHFKLKNLKPDIYHVMASNHSFSSSFGERNRIEVTLNKDLRGLVFNFSSAGKVFGIFRHKDPAQKMHLNISYKTGPETSDHDQLNTSMEENGYFEFPQVPIGTFDLWVHTSYQKPLSLLLSHIQMPEDGSDLDLGVLTLGSGHIHLALEAPPGFPKTPVKIFQVPEFSGTRTRQKLGEIAFEYPKILIEDVSLGNMHLTTSVRPGFRVDPAERRIHIKKNEVHHASFKLIPETHLELFPESQGKMLVFNSAVLIQESTRRRWKIPFVDSHNEVTEAYGSPLLLASPQQVIAKQVPMGWWEIHVTNQAGQTAKRRVHLTPGSAIRLPLRTHEFQQ